MATLVSPGVSVTVTDESFNVSSGPGTVPLVVFATEQDKLNAAGDGIAIGTTKANSGKLFLVSSQRELLQTYGTPNFNSVGGNQQNGSPLNEYGLLATHSYMGISNRAYALRADIDLAALQPLDNAPIAPPKDGSYWLDPTNTNIGLYRFDGTSWVKPELYLTDDRDENDGQPQNVPNAYSYAVTLNRTVTPGDTYENTVWSRIGTTSNWERVQSDTFASDIQYASVYPVLQSDNATPLASADLWLKTNEADYDVSVYDSAIGNFVAEPTPLFDTSDKASDWYADNLRTGDLFVQYNYNKDVTGTAPATTFQHSVRRYNGKTVVSVTSDWDFVAAVMLAGMQIDDGTPISISSLDLAGTVAAINGQLLADGNTYVEAVAVSGSLVIRNTNNSDLKIITTSGDSGIDDDIYSNWDQLTYEASEVAPAGDLAQGTLWYNPQFQVDILINDGVGAWGELAGELYIQPSEPTSPLDLDVWVDTDQLDEYPVIYKYNDTTSTWVLVDNTDQSTPNGILFSDARVAPGDAVDGDAPDALAYPSGMLLWNSRYSGRNVKEWEPDWTADGTLIGDRWVSKSGNDFDGSIITGEAATRKVVVTALQAAIASSEDIRAETVFFNLIAAPGYPELVDEMVTLNVDRKETGFVIGDSPMTLKANGTDIQAWSSNSNNAPSNGVDGLITADEYLGIHYPSGLTTNVDGTEVVVPPSHMALRTFAYNDQVAYQWFAPAGLNRGTVSNATSVGYIDDEGEYVSVDLSEGLRDILYTNNINPIRNVPNRGLTIWGQKTRSPVSSAMDRINVARLVNYIRYQSDLLAMPYLFEPNDQVTRKNIKTSFDSFLSELITLRGLYDFLVVCDQSNNTPARIDKNELWVDIAIQPTKAVEFIYVPIRIKSTGSDLAS